MAVTLSEAVKQLVLTVVSNSTSNHETQLYNGDQTIDTDQAAIQARIAKDTLKHLGRNIEYITVEKSSVIKIEAQPINQFAKMMKLLKMAQEITSGPILVEGGKTTPKTDHLFRSTFQYLQLAPAVLSPDPKIYHQF